MNRKKSAVTIMEFDPKYTDRVIQLIGQSLKDLEIIPQSSPPPDDPDLYQITKRYNGRSRFWVAIDNDILLGTVAIRELDKTTASLNRMFVSKEHHGTGVGQQLFDRAVAFARGQDFTELVLNSHINMKRAHAFYAKNGFKKTEEHPDKYSFKLTL